MQFSAADLDALFEDGPTITVGAENAKCVYREAAEGVVLEAQFSGLELHPTALVKAADLPSATDNMEATLGSRTFVIREIKPLSNGQFKRLTLVEKAL
jgi:hypothetical protein